MPCLSTDLTTRAVPHFKQALQMGRRAAPKARGAGVAIAVMMTLCADWTMGEGAKRGKVSEVPFGARRRARARRRCVPRRVSAKAKARGLAALSALGGLGRYWAAQWHLAQAVDKRFRGCRVKRLYVHHLNLT